MEGGFGYRPQTSRSSSNITRTTHTHTRDTLDYATAQHISQRLTHMFVPRAYVAIKPFTFATQTHQNQLHIERESKSYQVVRERIKAVGGRSTVSSIRLDSDHPPFERLAMKFMVWSHFREYSNIITFRFTNLSKRINIILAT